VLIHLASLVDGTGQPIKDLASSYRKPITGPGGSQSYPGGFSFLTGTAGAGVAGAVVHVRLFLGNSAVGHRLVADLPNVTLDANGTAALFLEAGTHVEDLSISVEVTSNPKNPWFLPGVRTGTASVFPAATTDDTVAQLPYRLTPMQTVAAGVHLVPFLADVRARQKEWTQDFKVFNTVKPGKAPPAPKFHNVAAPPRR
jgi:hypothetical protein